MTIRALAAATPGGRLTDWAYDPPPLADDEVEVAVEHCGVCHSDLSMLDNEWQRTRYPFVPGHEVVGRVIACGPAVRRVKPGDRVGVGWYAASCMHCEQCLRGRHHLCGASRGLITDGHGGFADRVRCHWVWATPLPEGLDAAAAGPLFCGGITVFGPIHACGVRPTDRVGVVGIGGLGHLALRFLRAWGCEVTAFTSSESKRAEALGLGAHHAVGTHDVGAIKALAGRFDFLLVTSNVPLPWSAYLGALAPHGRLHVVGAVLEPIPVPAFGLIGGQKSVSGSPLGSPATVADMLAFCARHDIAPVVERFPMSRADDALEHLRAGKARWRVVLDNDLA